MTSLAAQAAYRQRFFPSIPLAGPPDPVSRFRWVAWAALFIAGCPQGGAAGRAVQPLRVSSTLAPCGCDDDAANINAAVAALPPGGGKVTLGPGDFCLRRTHPRTSILIDRDNVVLEGAGEATRLLLADEQGVNVILIEADRVTVRDLYIDANRVGNWAPYGSRFDQAGIRTQHPNYPAEQQKWTTVEGCHIENAESLNVYLFGEHMIIRNNRLGDSTGPVTEILVGPGITSGNVVEIDETTGYVLTTDAASHVVISDNTVYVRPGGHVTGSVFVGWQGQYGNVVSDNIVYVHDEGSAEMVFDMRGYLNTVTGNVIRSTPRTRAAFSGSGTVIESNVWKNVDIEIEDVFNLGWPVVFGDSNVLINSEVTWGIDP